MENFKVDSETNTSCIKIVPDTKIHFLSTQYRLVFCLDLSSSVATIVCILFYIYLFILFYLLKVWRLIPFYRKKILKSNLNRKSELNFANDFILFLNGTLLKKVYYVLLIVFFIMCFKIRIRNVLFINVKLLIKRSF